MAAEAKCKNLQRTRRNLGRELTRLENFLKIGTSNQCTFSEFKLRLDLLNTSYEEFRTVQDEIESLDEDNLENDEIRDNMADRYLQAKISYTNHCETFVANNHARPPCNPDTEFPGAQLPPLALPKFDGSIFEYYSFKELFLTILQQGRVQSKAAKFYYLKSCLQGPAAEVISSIPATGNNYDVAWELLDNRYDNRNMIIDNHCLHIINADPVKTESSAKLRHVLDEFLNHVRSLKALEAIEDTNNPLLAALLLQKLDEETRRQWQLQRPANQEYVFKDLCQFLERRIQSLDAILPVDKPTIKLTRAHPAATYEYPTCVCCNAKTHRIYQCEKFKKMAINQRRDFVWDHRLCYNCLSPDHSASKCNLSKKCNYCGKNHHSLLHIGAFANPHQTADQSSTVTAFAPISIRTPNPGQSTPVLLSTAKILVQDGSGTWLTCRCLLDAGSQTSFISQRLASKLNIPLKQSPIKVLGIGNAPNKASQKVSASIKSRHGTFTCQVDLFVLPQITAPLPLEDVNITKWKMPRRLPLADESFHKSRRIDVLLGAQMFFEVLGPRRIAANQHHPFLQQTRFGWIVAGATPFNEETSGSTVMSALSLSEQVERFWQVEACVTSPPAKPEYQLCETLFQNSHHRLTNGRFVVKMPFKKELTSLGSSRHQARRRYLHLELKLSKNPQLKEEYHSFIQEYIALGHMIRLGSESEVKERSNHYYLPHHAVLKPHSTTTKLRVVFDASAKTTSGLALNDILATGPTVQEDLFSILLRFRKHPVALMADINKMYRQILITEQDRSQQLIFWRFSSTKPLQVYQLNTITYGTTAAPYLATRVLLQLAKDEENRYPKSAAAISDFYIDDVTTGCESVSEAIELQQQLRAMMFSGGFHLRKWASNDPKALEGIPSSDLEPLDALQLISEDSVKSLGLIWSTPTDTLQYDISNIESLPGQTKRKVLSQLASLYDPLGLLGPIVTAAKIFIQSLWKLHLTWDQKLPDKLVSQWAYLIQDLQRLSSLKIPRLIRLKQRVIRYELHGFSDASETAYGCCIYLKSITAAGQTSSNLICAKSRVAPQKQITLPRLELCAAVTLVRLLRKTVEALKLEIDYIGAWTDSTIVLVWLRAMPITWKTFVANRVTEIQEYPNANWNHVSSQENPADLISRGTSTENLFKCMLWWNGPTFLNHQTHKTPVNSDILEPPERRTSTVQVCINATSSCAFSTLVERFSDFNRLLYTLSWVRRFLHNAHNPKHKRIGPLSSHELHMTENMVIQRTQETSFSKELDRLKHNQTLHKKSPLLSLNPFRDSDEILRVGGRLTQTSCPYEFKHQAILPSKHHITKLIIMKKHIHSLHGGAQLTLSLLRQQYWIIHGKGAVRSVLRSCTQCFRAKPTNVLPIMGVLPKARVEPARPFLSAGIDFCGPFYIKPPVRSKVELKAYIALFICMATKAIHLELVTSLSTEAFIAALDRFVSRRGMCHHIYSDNATNFTGAERELKSICQTLKESEGILTRAFPHITWHFIPPHAPNFGGLWESGVKLIKYHLKRVAGLALCTYEEFNTLLIQIEACVNSRPITEISSDSNDCNALSPGHFLIGEPLLAVPTLDVSNDNINRLVRWNRIQAITQHFWKRWSLEYLASLQPRQKQRIAYPQSNWIGKLVVIKEDNIPPQRWVLGRIKEIFPGPDGIVRVATVKTTHGLLKRSLSRLYPLPVENTEHNPDSHFERSNLSRRAEC